MIKLSLDDNTDDGKEYLNIKYNDYSNGCNYYSLRCNVTVSA